MVGHDPERWILSLLGQGKELLCQFVHGAVLGKRVQVGVEASQHRDELGCALHATAEIARSIQGCSHAWGCPTLGDDRGGGQMHLQGQLQLIALNCGGQGL
jgi:hypothetical protein